MLYWKYWIQIRILLLLTIIWTYLWTLVKALFVCTANDLSSIPQPLVDRMEVIRISGYDYKEKLEISKNYLEKKARIATGLEK